jgi:hypothetical protein
VQHQVLEVRPDRGPCLISNQAGAIGKDTWVLASEPGQQVSLWTPETRAAVAPACPASSRSAGA